MRYFRLSLLIIVACLLFATPLVLAGCGGGISDEQRQTYLQLAVSYESKAKEAQSQAEVLRMASYQRGYTDSQRQAFVEGAKAKEDLASDYRQQALKYRELAAK